MLLIGCSHIDEVIDLLKDKEIDGCKFEFVKKQGIQAYFKHNAESDMQAKAICKKTFRSVPGFESYYLSVQIVEK